MEGVTPLSLEEIIKTYPKQREFFKSKNGREYPVELYRDKEKRILYVVPGFGGDVQPFRE